MKATIFALGLAGCIAAIPATAHHSFDGSFDRGKLVKLSGTVAEFRFTNPHAMIVLTVTDADGTKHEWLVETTSAQSLANRGWTPESIKAGEALVVEGWPAWNGKSYVRLSKMAHTDGSAVGLWLPDGPTPRPAA